jgi:beta-lactamase class C
LKTRNKLGLGVIVAVVVASVVAMQSHSAQQHQQQHRQIVAAHLKLASLSTASRRDVDYRLLDARLQQLMTKPAMVGLAVGIVENGRITFLKGYGETLRGSGDPVTPATVFRWASCSKGVAATMVAKLAEDGKLNLNAPVADYAPDL